MTDWDEKAGPAQRWVCTACGKATDLGETRYALRDTSCLHWAVLCHADKDAEGRWVALPASAQAGGAP